MGKIYDDWGKLVEAVLRREKLREIAMCHSRDSSIASDGSSCFSFSFPLLFSEQFLEYDFNSEKPLQLDPESLAFYQQSSRFRDVPHSEKSELFILKAKMCCVVFDFSDPTIHLKQKEIKRHTLYELVEHVASSKVDLTETVMKVIFKMVSVNIFSSFTIAQRDNNSIVCLEQGNFPTTDSAWSPWQTKNNVAVFGDMKYSGKENDEHEDSDLEEVELYPAWYQLQLVYKLLLRLVASPEANAKFAKTYFESSFINKLLDLFNSEDCREREYLKAILHRIYQRFRVHRPFIRKALDTILYNVVHVTGKHNGIAEFLEFLGSVVSGFNLPLKEEYKISFRQVLIPLHKPKCLAKYQKELSYCLVEFVKKDRKLACLAIEGLIKYWSVNNRLNELLFLQELEEVLEVTQEREFTRCMVPLSNQISRCLSSEHHEVVEKVLSLLRNKHIQNLIAQNHKVMLPIIYPTFSFRDRLFEWVVDGLYAARKMKENKTGQKRKGTKKR